MRNGERRGRYVVYERGLLRPCAAALEGGPTCGSSDDLGEALGMLVFRQVDLSRMGSKI